MPLDRAMFDKMTFYREAIASVSLSHREGCSCIACRSADGDEEAFNAIVDALEGHGKEEILKGIVPVRQDVADEEGSGGS